MTKLGEAKIFGGIGALLSLLGFVPYAGPLLGLIGLILIFIAVKHIAEETKNHKIFQDYFHWRRQNLMRCFVIDCPIGKQWQQFCSHRKD